MGIQRVKTQSSHLGVFNLEDYEFDSGFVGFCQRVYISSRNATIRFYRAFKFFITSFLGLHYIYIIMWSLILSWIVYGERNMSYTDALFQAVSSTTLTGLNTIDINKLKTYQQVCLFVLPVFAHPLTIATFMVFYRLYLYRKKFSDIEQTSKFQSKLRRQATFSQYETMRRGGYGREQAPQAVDLQLPRESDSPFDGSDSKEKVEPLTEENASEIGKDSSSTGPSGRDSRTDDNSSLQSQTHSSSHSPQRGPHGIEATHDNNGGDDDEDDDAGNKIRFGALPRPPSRERQHDPHEMFRSLTMMRNQNLRDEMDEDDGPALVIKSPRDIEADERRGIHSAVVDTSSNAAASSSQANDTHNSLSANISGFAHHPFRRLSNVTMAESVNRPHRPLTRADTLMSMASARNPRSMASNYLSWTPTVGRNSAFIGLSREQKEELGGVEYRALKMLRWLGIGYYIVILCLGWLFITPWVYKQKHYRELIESYGLSPVNFSLTTVLSAFNNSGLCEVPTSISEFWHTAYVPVVFSFVIMAGNAALPIVLRFVVYVIFHLSPRFGQTRETMGFLLDHPRRCFMLIFPSTTTWWLAVTIFLFIIIDVAFFMILDHGDHSPHPDMAAGPRLLSAYFQSVAVRTVGLTIIDIGAQAPGMLVLNLVMMYIAIYPIAMSIRSSNVYEEQTLGHYYTIGSHNRGDDSAFPDNRSVSSNAIDDDESGVHAANTSVGRGNDLNSGGGFMQRMRRRSTTLSESRGDAFNNAQVKAPPEDSYEEEDEDDFDRPSALMDHMRRQLSMDVWSLVLGLFLVAISEGGSITRGRYTLFAVIFEVVSAHGTIGWSMGLPGGSVSLSGGFSNVGKLIMMAIMIRGRHRCMPYNVDRAIILKGNDLIKRDRQQENRARDARLMTYREPSQSNNQWLPRVATSASRLTSFGTLRRRPSASRHNSQVGSEHNENHHQFRDPV